jgi:Lipocalin-like domain
MNATPGDSPLIGTWRLVSWENQAADGEITYPMGPDALGYILYTEDGHFSVTVMRSNRTPFVAGDLLTGTTDEKVTAMESCAAYCGRYSFHGDHIIHQVELSLFPNWIGTAQRRGLQLDGTRLTLSAGPLTLAGKEQMARLVWERANG